MARSPLIIAIGAATIAGMALFLKMTPPEPSVPESELELLLAPRLIAQNQCGRGGRERASFFKPSFQIALASSARAATRAEEKAPLWPGLGKRTVPITTASAEAQTYFDQGFAFLYGFNHWEAIRSFQQAQELDPGCAMCYWGEAKARGPNINAPMDKGEEHPALTAVKRAVALSDNVTAKERGLIEALALRYTPDGDASRADLDKRYAEAMTALHERFPDDQDIAVLYAEAQMDLSPWNYWERDYKTPLPHIAGAIAAVEDVLAANPDHAGAIHLHIHLLEASAMPERAEEGAERLADLMPGAGHLVHMPGHIFFRVGRYLDSLETNVRAVEVDEAYLAKTQGSDIYRYGYYPHNVHFVLVSAQMAGDAETAMEYARKLDGLIPFEAVTSAAIVQPVKVAPYYAFLDFGTPEDIANMPEPPENLPFVKGIWRYVQGVAAVRADDIARARAEADAIAALRDDEGLADLAAANVPAEDILLLSETVLRARIAQHEGDFAQARSELERAVTLQDALNYTEPPFWYYPVEQTLGAVLLQAGDPEAAIEQFRAALVRHPNNAWSLYGLMKAQEAAGDETAGYTSKLLKEAAFDPGAITIDRL
ncbi:tetratricopeptide repeat protein [Parvibaculum sp.]|uniref:tetratricopeptide repeat protein n=1 Tax=Parvibaculum sp. TaxID=2024848 RepID=UPI000EDDD905|nr:tetratricopeptide repeat protein [Parvibaculum sp.]MBO6667655.1 tetratricopeptide repeat protein [Parvibaculum sp.]MBO6693253.1 tetratricopeptide repeat protein [Parvibaculum sp.]MBO6715260.1 tetratricopeptide repeat protein [Parvibaculum sp.]HAC58283.1 hypothetical protein [Rhodobiaceae bacterium]